MTAEYDLFSTDTTITQFIDALDQNDSWKDEFGVDGESVLMFAAKNNDIEKLKHLLLVKCDLDLQSKQGGKKRAQKTLQEILNPRIKYNALQVKIFKQFSFPRQNVTFKGYKHNNATMLDWEHSVDVCQQSGSRHLRRVVAGSRSSTGNCK